MQEDQLPTALFVSAHIRRFNAEGLSAFVIRKGPESGGTVLVRVSGRERMSKLWSQVRDLDGRLGWLPAVNGEAVPDPDADAYIDRAVRRDPDLWVVEVETPELKNPFEGKEL